MKPVFSKDSVKSSMELITSAHAEVPHVTFEYLALMLGHALRGGM